MKERTEIDQQSLHFTYMELASCRTYDDARDLLNELVTMEIGREYGDNYEFDEVTMFAVANGNVRLLNTLSGAASPLPFGSPSVCFS